MREIANAHWPRERDQVPYAATAYAVLAHVLWKRASIPPSGEWILALAVRWTRTHVNVRIADPRAFQADLWLPASDVRRTMVTAEAAGWADGWRERA